MNRIRPTEDVQPLSSFRSGMAGFIERVRETGRPLILTYHGTGVAVVLDAGVYESMVERLERQGDPDELRTARHSDAPRPSGDPDEPRPSGASFADDFVPRLRDRLEIRLDESRSGSPRSPREGG